MNAGGSGESPNVPGENGRGKTLLFFAAGGALILGCVLLSVLSRRFPFGADPMKRPVLRLVALEVAMGALYVAFVLWLARQKKGTGVFFVRRRLRPKGAGQARISLLFLALIAAGLFMRGALFPSTVILEDDVYRYLWDGAVVAHGGNPYAYAPAAVMANDGEATGRARGPGDLAAQAGDTLRRINHPQLRTIYPPVAQGAFALAHVIRPFNVLGLRIVFLAFDVLLLVVLVRILDVLGRSRIWLVVYWWNPLVVAQIYNRCHMDVIPAALVAAALLLTIRRRDVLASVVLALAVGAKLWPVVLLPVVLRNLTGSAKRLAVCAGVFAAIAGVVCLPMLGAGIEGSSGLYEYGRSWSNNDSIHRVVVRALQAALAAVKMPAWAAPGAGRVIVALALVVFVARLMRTRIEDAGDVCRRAVAIVAALFLLSPTQFPWYYIWLAPLLAVHPRVSLLLPVALLPLYYIRAWFDARGLFDRYENLVIAIEFVPVWVLLIREWIVARRGGQVCLSEAGDQHA